MEEPASATSDQVFYARTFALLTAALLAYLLYQVLSPLAQPIATKDGWIALLPYTTTQWVRVLKTIGREDITAEHVSKVIRLLSE